MLRIADANKSLQDIPKESPFARITSFDISKFLLIGNDDVLPELMLKSFGKIPINSLVREYKDKNDTEFKYSINLLDDDTVQFNFSIKEDKQTITLKKTQLKAIQFSVEVTIKNIIVKTIETK